MAKELIKRDVLVLTTGCATIACSKQGLTNPKMALELAGPGLREVCEAVGIPPVLTCGSCVDNSRLLVACTEIVRESVHHRWRVAQVPVKVIYSEYTLAKGQSFAHGVKTAFKILLRSFLR